MKPQCAVDPPSDVARWLDDRVERLGSEDLFGRGYQAEVYGLASPFGPLVVKKASGSGLSGLLARHALRHESRIYQQLSGVPGTPKYFGLFRDSYLVLERIGGQSLRIRDKSLRDPARFYERLLAQLDAIHAAGIAHGDLKRKNNILVADDEQPFIIDFGIAWRLPANASRWRRFVFRLVEQMDYNAWVKHRYGRPPYDDSVPTRDLARYKPLLVERVARAIRIPWQKLTLRRLRKRIAARKTRP